MIEGIILGTIQGVTEWLPISSEGILVLVKVNFFADGETLGELIGLALFLHLGTFLAAAWYLRDDVLALLKMLFTPHRLLERGEGFLRFHRKRGEIENMLRFLVLATFLSGVIGYFLIDVFLPLVEQHVALGTKVITAGVGVLLLTTGSVEFRARRKRGRKTVERLKDRDGVLLGVVQGFAALPGFSRSGLTISALLLRKFDDITALRLSFLMSLPVVLGGNVLLNLREGFLFSPVAIFGFVFSFLFGIFTIHVLFRVARKVQFSYFVLGFGALTLAAAFFL